MMPKPEHNQQQEQEKLLYSVQEIAHALSVSTITVRRLVEKGQLKAVRIGRRVLVRPESVEAFLEIN